MSSTYHPQTYGQIEVINKCLKAYIRCFVIDIQTHWSQWLHLAEWWYNSTYHTSVKMTPFQDLYEYEPPNWKEFVLNDTNVPEVRNQLEKTKETIESLKYNLNTAQNHMRQQTNQHTTER